MLAEWSFPSDSDSKESAHNARWARHWPRFSLWFGKFLWRREWQATPVFLAGEFHGQRSLMNYNPWGNKGSERTERLTHTHAHARTRTWTHTHVGWMGPKMKRSLWGWGESFWQSCGAWLRIINLGYGLYTFLTVDSSIKQNLTCRNVANKVGEESFESEFWLNKFNKTWLVRNLPANAEDVRDAGSIPAWERSPGEVHGKPLQCSCLESPMDRGAWGATVHWVRKFYMSNLTP